MMRRVTGIAVLSLAAGLAPLGAEEASTPAKRELRESLSFSVNNLGLQNALELRWNWRLTDSERPLKRDAHFSTGLSHIVTPAYTRLGAWVELAPLSILQVRVGAEPGYYFGSFDSLMSYDGYGEAFDRRVRAARHGQSAAGFASRVYVSPTLKLRVGRFVAAASADFEWWKSNAAGPVFYEPLRDTLLKVSGDRLLATQSVLLRETHTARGGKLSYGLIHQFTTVPAAPLNKSQRIGVLAIREYAGKRFGLDHPRLLGHVSYYLDDRSKQRQISAAIALSFKVAG